MLFAEAIRGALEDSGMLVLGVSPRADEAIGLVERSLPDLVLMDLGLPDASGLVAGRSMLDRWPEIKILALTGLNDRLAVDEALQLGFFGYLTKSASITQLVSSIRSVLDGDVVVPYDLSPARRRSTCDDHAALLGSRLSCREKEVLTLLVQGASGETISSALGISRNTVRTHVQNILVKLQVHSRLEAAAFALVHRVVSAPMLETATATPDGRRPT